MNNSNSRVWLALRLLDLPLKALPLQDYNKPLVVSETKRVIYANPLAEAAGARVGMDTTTAQLISGSEIVTRDREQEQLALVQLTEQLYQFTPHIDRYDSAQSAQAGLLLEISSCLKLFGGLSHLAEKIFTSLAQTRFGFCYGLAHSAPASWYLSFTHHAITGSETRELFIERLNCLPLELLVDYPAIQTALGKMGFTRFGDLARQIHGKSLRSLHKRLGREFTELLSELYDIDQDFSQPALFDTPRHSYRPKEWFQGDIQFEYPVTVVEQLKPAIENLLQQLANYLRKRQQQCQAIEWQIADIYRQQETLRVHSDTPQSEWQLLYDLSLIQFENKELPFEVDSIRLLCPQASPAQHASRTLAFDARRRAATVQDFTTTMAKLKARLGDAAVYKLSYEDSLVPELTNRIVSLAEKCHQQLPDVHRKALRPAWLLRAPELITQRGQRLYWQGYVTPLVGPERIIGNWWEEAIARDYYLAQRQDKLPLWIFFNLYDKQWYVHGVFG